MANRHVATEQNALSLEDSLYLALEQDDIENFKNYLEALSNQDTDSSETSLGAAKLAVDLKIHDEPLICAAARKGSVKVVNFLVDNGADIQATKNTLGTENALQLVCRLFGFVEKRKNERLAIAKLLIARGIKVNAGSGKEYTALHNAVLSEFDEMVSLLLNHEADPDAWDSIGRTPLALLIEQHKDQSSQSTIELLLKEDADINAQDRIGFSPWTYACSFAPTLKPLLTQYRKPSTHLSKNAKQAQELEKLAASLGLYGDVATATDRAKHMFDESKRVPSDLNKPENLAAAAQALRNSKSGVTEKENKKDKKDKNDKDDDFGSGLSGLRGAFTKKASS